MLQNLRDNLKGIGFVICVIIAIPFALTGVERFFVGGTAVTEVASVNGTTITQADVIRAIGPQGQQLLSQYGENIRGLLERQALGQLVQQLVVEQAASDLGMGVAKQSIDQSLRETTAFQSDGKFDQAQFTYLLGQVGHTPSSYLEQLRREFLTHQFVQGVMASDFTTDNELAQSAAVSEQQRDFYYLTVPVEPLLDTVEVTEDALTARYEASKDKLVVPEQVVVEYIELDADTLLAVQTVSEDQVKQRFDSELEQARQIAQDQQRLAHILITKSDDNSHESVLKEVQEKMAAGEDFAELAKRYSQDPGTSELGGDLGFIDPAALPAELSAAASTLELNGVSAPVESDSGFHLLKVTDVQQAQLPTFDEQKERIEGEIKLELALEKLPVLVEELQDRVYSAETLQEPADALELELKVSEPFSRSGGTGITANQTVLAAVFSDDVLTAGYASEVIELDDNKAIVVKLRERIAERVKSLDEVREELLAELKFEEAKAQVKSQGESLLARANAGESVEAIAKAEGLEWQVSPNTKRSGGNVDVAVRNKAFSMAVPQGSSLADGLTQSNGDYLIVELTAVEYPKLEELPSAQHESLSQNLMGNVGERSILAYQQWLRQQADIEGQ